MVPQFASAVFGNFRKDWKYIHTTGSPHFPQSNGRMEAAANTVHKILHRCADLKLALLENSKTLTRNFHTVQYKSGLDGQFAQVW